MHFKVAIRNFAQMLVVTISMQDNKMIRVAVSLVSLCISNTKVNLPQPLSLQLGCNQDTHFMVKTTNLFFSADK